MNCCCTKGKCSLANGRHFLFFFSLTPFFPSQKANGKQNKKRQKKGHNETANNVVSSWSNREEGSRFALHLTQWLNWSCFHLSTMLSSKENIGLVMFVCSTALSYVSLIDYCPTLFVKVVTFDISCNYVLLS